MSKILIVEDEESIAELEKDYLELSGFEVEIENDGEAGLKRRFRRSSTSLSWILCCREWTDLRSVRRSERRKTHR